MTNLNVYNYTLEEKLNMKKIITLMFLINIILLTFTAYGKDTNSNKNFEENERLI